MNQDTAIRIEGSGQVAEISRLGAEPVLWGASGRPLLWQPDPAVWPRVSPVLFPTVGRAAGDVIRIGGRVFPMPVHGFAAGSRFDLVTRNASSARFALASCDETKARFPFDFRLEATYCLNDDGFLASFEVVNTGREALPYALGLHPGFRWPYVGTARDGHRVLFEKNERADVPVITAEGLFARDSRRIPVYAKALELGDALLAREALCFLDANSRSLRFEAPDGSAIAVEVENFRHLALWSRPPAPFLSIEAWTGHGDPDGFAGELVDKPSMTMLAPGTTAEHAMRWRFEPTR